jgi:hypothetical protein
MPAETPLDTQSEQISPSYRDLIAAEFGPLIRDALKKCGIDTTALEQDEDENNG